MNELHLSAKDARDKVANRAQHVVYLEDNLESSQNRNAKLLEEREASEKTLRAKVESLEKTVEEVGKPLWQLEEPGTSLPPLPSRITLPFSTKENGLLKDTERRLSTNESDKWVDLYFRPGDGTYVSPSPSNAVNETGPSGKKKKSVDDFLFMDEGDDDSDDSSKGPSEVPPSRNGSHAGSHYGDLVDAYKSVSETSAVPSEIVKPKLEPDTSSSSLDTKQNEASEVLPNDSSHSPAVAQPQKWSKAEPHPEPTTEEAVEAKRKSAYSSKEILSKLKAKTKAQNKGDDEDDGVPEWMKKFRKIGMKNANEGTIETQGAAPAVPLTRTLYGEHLKLHDKHSEPITAYSSSTVKWTPRKKKSSDDSSSDDSFAAAFGGDAQVAHVDNDSSSDDESDAQDIQQVSRR